LPSLGTVNNLKGLVYVVREGKREALGNSSQVLYPGESVVTEADSGLSIKWAAGSSIRVDQNSELLLSNVAELGLVSGRVYVDVPLLASGKPAPDLAVSTRFGIVKHIGTQFMVSSLAEAMQVLVREGSVSISNDIHTVVAAAGSQATLDSADNISRESVAVFGSQWQWAEQLAPAFEVDGLPLFEVLKRISRETGKPILYDSAEAERIAATTIMHGNIDEDPEYALEIVLQTNDLSWFEKDGKVHLFVSQ
jgi:ferric-dicitrate binding protein FerR (iron transport regulator)